MDLPEKPDFGGKNFRSGEEDFLGANSDFQLSVIVTNLFLVQGTDGGVKIVHDNASLRLKNSVILGEGSTKGLYPRDLVCTASVNRLMSF